MTTDNLNACETCGDGCTDDCPDRPGDGFCRACGADNINVVYVDGDDCTWAWDGETPCPNCGWSREAQL